MAVPNIDPILVFGARGQLGSALRGQASDRLIPATRTELDLESASQEDIQHLIERAGAGAIVNASAYSKVDRAETDTDRAWAINAVAPFRIAAACSALGLPFVHVSTDYVFAGDQPRAWTEDDRTEPSSVYGRSKLAGEEAVLAANPDSLVVRTSWLVSEHGSNFLLTILRLAAEHDRLRIVDDQQGVPTDADALAAFLIAAADRMIGGDAPSSGLLHFRSSGPAVSWAGFAQAILDAAKGPRAEIEAITTADYGALAPRPANSVLSIERLESLWGWSPPDWREGLSRIVAAVRRPD